MCRGTVYQSTVVMLAAFIVHGQSLYLATLITSNTHFLGHKSGAFHVLVLLVINISVAATSLTCDLLIKDLYLCNMPLTFENVRH